MTKKDRKKKPELQDQHSVKDDLLILSVVSIITKFIVLFGAPAIGAFIDYFDIKMYYTHAEMMAVGQSPFTPDFPYPVLVLVPLGLSFAVSHLLQNAYAFVYTFQFLMVICDLITTGCVYFIALKIWNDRKIAFRAGIAYAVAFSAAYFVMTKYDAFPACLMMVALTATIYRKELAGYTATVLGFFTKVFPVAALPFIIFYNAKRTSLKQEVVTAAKVAVPAFLVLFVPLAIISPETIQIYLPARSDLGYYANTLTFTLYTWVHDVLMLRFISIDAVSVMVYAVAGIGIAGLVYSAYKSQTITGKRLIQYVLCTVMLVIFCFKVRSPQYAVWYVPLICLLLADDVRKLVLVAGLQVIAFIEFPAMFGRFYTAVQYTNAVRSYNWWLTLTVFTLEYIMLIACIWIAVKPGELIYLGKNNNEGETT